MLSIKDLVVSYGVAPVLHNINLEVPDGKVVTLLGSNGAGKSTTLKTISSLLRPLNGDIEFEGKSIVGLPPEKLIKLGISHVPEGRQIFPGLTVEENLKMGAYSNYSGANKKIEEIYDLFPRLLERKKQLAGTLSGGEQQMLVIGRGMMSSPKLLMLDEPSLGLAPIIIEDIFEKIKEINAAGMTILLIEQNASLALSYSHYAYVLSVGKIVAQGEAEKLKNDKSIMDAYLGGSH